MLHGLREGILLGLGPGAVLFIHRMFRAVDGTLHADDLSPGEVSTPEAMIPRVGGAIFFEAVSTAPERPSRGSTDATRVDGSHDPGARAQGPATGKEDPDRDPLAAVARHHAALIGTAAWGVPAADR